jgi:hypothetical protein
VLVIVLAGKYSSIAISRYFYQVPALLPVEEKNWEEEQVTSNFEKLGS